MSITSVQAYERMNDVMRTLNNWTSVDTLCGLHQLEKRTVYRLLKQLADKLEKRERKRPAGHVGRNPTEYRIRRSK